MKIRDVFNDVIVGYNLNNTVVNDQYSMLYKTLQKDSIQYTNVIKSRLIDKVFSSDIKSKYLWQLNITSFVVSCNFSSPSLNNFPMIL